MKAICVLLHGAIKHDARVQKTIATLSETARVDLFYIGGSDGDQALFNDRVRVFAQPPPSGLITKVLRHSFLHLEYQSLAQAVERNGIRYDWIYANDLPTLNAGVQLKRRLGARLAYDAHEIYVETLNQFFPVAPSRTKAPLFRALLRLMRRLARQAEQHLVRYVDAFITVNQSLAEYFQREYGVSQIHVVMNCPSHQAQSPLPALDFRQRYGWQQNDEVLIYQGVLNQGRGLDMLLRALALAPHRFKLVIIGDGVLRQSLEVLAQQLELGERVHFFGRVPQAELLSYTVAADAGINLVEDFNLSKKLSSPNKLFEYMHAGIPILASDTVENRRVLDEFKAGVLTSNQEQAIAHAMAEVTHPAHQDEFRTEAGRGAKHYSWEHQAEVLRRLFSDEGT